MQEVETRKFRIWDIPFVYNLSNQRTVKTWSRSRQISNILQHIEDIVSKKFIIMYKGRKAGMIRLYQREISIAVSEDLRNKGIATEALKQLCSTRQGLWASINKDNRISQRLFMGVGFLYDYEIAQEVIYKWK